jgi:hypothetical protein
MEPVPAPEGFGICHRPLGILVAADRVAAGGHQDCLDHRGSDLRIGDRVIACDGVRYERDKRKEFSHKAFGSHSESQHWEQAHVADGQAVVVTVLRGSTVIDVAGNVLA